MFFSLPFHVCIVTCLLFCLTSFVQTAPGKLPDNFPKCKRSEPQFNDCLTKAVQAVLPSLVKGVPSLGIFPIDPLRITQLDIPSGKGRPVAVNMRFKNLDIKGFKSAKIISVKQGSDIGKFKSIVQAELQEPLILDGDYEINGKVLILPITGKGRSVLKLDNLKTTLTLTGKELKKDGVLYMDLKDFDVKFETSRLTMKFENLFNSDRALGDNMNNFLNDNWREILGEVKPAFEEALGATFKELARRVYTKVPYNDIYL